ncbi:MAG: hypothetical protein EPO68_04940 [Planctomycetota bacterium]|nr:MAG: hypothetical protein EPO68_04940 [Planctomycetota bacterium]
MLVERSRSLLRLLFALSVGMSVLALGFAAQNTLELANGATRRDVESKALRLQPAFQQLCANLRATLPADADVLLEPSRLDRSGVSPQSRWHLSFNYELAPIRCYTREPAAASGTLVDWPRWVERHFPGAVFEPDQALAPIPDAELERAFEQRRIRWRITYPQAAQLAVDEVRLWRRESGMWKAVPLAQAPAPEPASPLRSLGAAFAVAASLFVAGSGLVRALGARARAAAIEWASDGLAIGLALGACAVLAWCAGSRGALTPTVGRALLGAFAAAGALGWWIARRSGAAAASTAARPKCASSPWTRTERALAALCIAFCAYAALQAYGVPLHRFDATQHFAYKARLLASEGLGGAGWTDLDGPVGRIVTHPTYPPLAGALTALCSSVRGAFDPDAGKLLAACFVPLGAVWLFRWLRPRSRTAGLLAALAWCGLPFVYYAWTSASKAGAFDWIGLVCGPALAARLGADGYAQPYFSDLLDGTGDLPLAALCIGLALALRELVASRAELASGALARGALARGVVVAGVLAAAALLVKNEGLPLVALLVLGACVASWRGASVPRIGLALAVAAVCAAPWWIAKRAIPPIDENYGGLLRPAHVLASLDRASVVGSEFLAAFGRVLRWNLLWPLCALALVLALPAWRSARRDFVALAPAVVGGACAYFAVLLVTPWDLQVLFSTYIPDRLFVHLAPLAVALVAAIAWPPRESCA